MTTLNAIDKNRNLICKTGSSVEKENTSGRTEMTKGSNCFMLIEIRNKYNKLIYLKNTRLVKDSN